jgi:hypothetical protein
MQIPFVAAAAREENEIRVWEGIFPYPDFFYGSIY